MNETSNTERDSRRSFLKKGVVAGALSVTGLTSVPGVVAAATITVPDDYSTIQAAVDDAASGDTVVVESGTYTEEVTIDKDLTLRGENTPTIQSPASLSSRGIVRAEGTVDVTVDGFDIDGAGNGDGESDFEGVVYDGASGSVRSTTVRRVRDDPLSGVQRGAGVLVRGGGSVDIEDNVVEDYQKTGIVVQGSGTEGDVKRNTVTGAGATDVIGQNGIQLSGGADGTVQDNEVADNVYDDPDDNVVATGVLLFGVSDVTIQQNASTNNEIGVASVGDGNKIVHNDVKDGSDDDWGVLLFPGDNNKVTNNSISDYTVGVQIGGGSNNKVIRNQFTDVDDEIVNGGTDTKIQPS